MTRALQDLAFSEYLFVMYLYCSSTEYVPSCYKPKFPFLSSIIMIMLLVRYFQNIH